MSEILDYSFSRPNLDQVKAAGYVGVMRYMSWLPNSKCLIKNRGQNASDYSERDAILSRGLMLGLNWEFRAEDALESDGVDHAKEALRQAKLIGYPEGCCIYFSCADIDIKPGGSMDAVRRYIHNCKAVLGGYYRIGLYGGKYPLSVCFNEGLIDCGWQACVPWAWYQNGPKYPGNKYPLASAYQYHNGATVGGAEVDKNLINPVRALYIWGSDNKMDLTNENLDAIVKHFFDFDYIPAVPPDPKNPTWALRTFLPGLYKAVLDGQKSVDVNALADAVVAKLGGLAVPDPAALKQAVKDALKEGTA